jgi:hypothetical protein
VSEEKRQNDIPEMEIPHRNEEKVERALPLTSSKLVN